LNRLALTLVAALVAGCGSDGGGHSSPGDAQAADARPTPDAAVDATPDAAPDAGPTGEQRLLAVPETETWQLPGLTGSAYVVRTEGSIPHVYARTTEDAGRVMGFVLARDRYFFMDLQRRLAKGRISELLGDRALANDVDARLTGYAYVGQRLEERLSPRLRAYLQAACDGVNAYIQAVKDHKLPGPSELTLAGPLLGARNPADLMQPFEVGDLTAMAAIPMFETNFRGEDVVRTQKRERLATAFDGVPNADLRRDGFLSDVWSVTRPLFPHDNSAPDFGTAGVPKRGTPALRPRALHVERGLLDRLVSRLPHLPGTLTHKYDGPHGSNAWAVSGDFTAHHGALVAGDGHLSLSVPSLMYQMGIDTQLLGGGDLHIRGSFLTPIPIMGVGTNGDVAWSMVNPRLDITDWYREEIQLGADGLPAASRFQGQWRPLVAVDESYVVANVPVLGSHGRTETWKRYTTFDGRWLLDVEGDAYMPPYDQATMGAVVNLGDRLVHPRDVDGDGVVTAVSFDHGAFDASRWADALFDMGLAADVNGFREASRGLVGGGLFMAAGDKRGNILYSSYQAVPCRTYLPRQDGRFMEGADPDFLIDGTTYGGFSMPTDDQGHADESKGAADPYQCIVPFDAMPQSINPARGFVFTANNEPAPIDDDGLHDNDAWYIGGPWESVRADSIRQGLEAATAGHAATIDDMAHIQAAIRSRLGERYLPHLLAALDAGAAAQGADAPESTRRLGALYAAHAADFAQARGYLGDWTLEAASGVATFYHTPGEHEARDAVATMLFNTWLPRFLDRVWGDEPVGDLFPYQPFYAQNATTLAYLDARHTPDPALHAIDPATGEAVFFDRTETPESETADEDILEALAGSIAFLQGPPGDAPGQGGFGNDDMSTWLWGMRHQVRFESLLAGFLGADSSFSALTDRFAINTSILPLAPGLSRDDPRAALRWFPRGGDNFSTDAAEPEYGAYENHYTHGPVMRMVIALGPDGVQGQNIIPGGQSALTDSPFFADQAALWLGNQTWPLRFAVDEVVAGATGRETYTP
jgi:penicillin amidase